MAARSKREFRSLRHPGLEPGPGCIPAPTGVQSVKNERASAHPEFVEGRRPFSFGQATGKMGLLGSGEYFGACLNRDIDRFFLC